MMAANSPAPMFTVMIPPSAWTSVSPSEYVLRTSRTLTTGTMERLSAGIPSVMAFVVAIVF